MRRLRSCGMPLRQATFLVPGGLRRTTGGNIYDQVVIEALRGRGWSVDVAERAPDHAADLVIQDSLAIPAGPPAAVDRLVPLFHQLPSDANGRPRWRTPERAALRSASLVVTVSRHLADRVSSETDAAVAVVPPGWDRAFASHRADRGIVLAVANAGPRKGVADAIEAFASARLRSARFVLAGDTRGAGAESERIDAYAADLGPALLLDGVLDPPALAGRYGAARVFVTASSYEGWPIGVAEAMASGLPIVAFDVPGVRELVRDGEDGILAETGDVDGLARAIRRLWDDPALRHRMGLTARERARSGPTWEQTGRRFARVLESLVAGDHPAGAE
jgi:glycosyltransferase involved in cell wall biosynthesis